MVDWFGMWGDIPYFTEFITTLFIVNLLIAFTIIFLERKNPSAALAWIMILFLLPIAGIVLYFPEYRAEKDFPPDQFRRAGAE